MEICRAVIRGGFRQHSIRKILKPPLNNDTLYSIPRRGILIHSAFTLRFDNFVTLSVKSVSTFM